MYKFIFLGITNAFSDAAKLITFIFFFYLIILFTLIILWKKLLNIYIFKCIIFTFLLKFNNSVGFSV